MSKFKTLAIRLATGIVVVGVVGTAIMAILARVIKSPISLGVNDGKLAHCPNSPNCVSTQSQDERHQIAPIPYTTSLAEAKRAMLDVVRSMERTKIITEGPAYIHAEFRTTGVGYVDDVEFYFDEATRMIHFRSSSRLPYWDWNGNRIRMEAVRAAFETTAD